MIHGTLIEIFKGWQEKIARPIVVNLATALILFLASLSFQPVRTWFFPPKTISIYPLICTAEPHVSNDDNHKLIVDFFIINRTGKPYTREDLVNLLQTNNPDRSSNPSPDIELKYWRSYGKFEKVYVDEEFNDQKGVLEAGQESDRVMLKVININERAIMKVTLVVDGIPDLKKTSISRMNKEAVPFLYEDYEDACYMRNKRSK